MHARLSHRWLGLALAWTATHNAQGAAWYVGDVGATGLSQGGAFVASPASLLAVHYNPAGLSRLKGFHVELSLAGSQLNAGFTRQCPCLLNGDSEVDANLAQGFRAESARHLTPIPFLALGYGFDFMDLTIALAAYGPTAGRPHWSGPLPEPYAPGFVDAAQAAGTRYSALYSDVYEANIGLGVGLQPIDGLRIGGTVFLAEAGNAQQMYLWTNADIAGLIKADAPEDVNFDLPLLLDFVSPFQLNWQVGASYDFLPGWTIGASFRVARHFTADGTLSAQLPRQLVDDEGVGTFGTTLTGNRASFELSTASIARLGVQYAKPEHFRVEAAVVAEFWSVHDEVVIRPQGVRLETEFAGIEPADFPTFRVPRQWKDTFSLRLGGEYRVIPELLDLRGGYFYEPPAVPADRLEPALVDLHKHGVSIGLRTMLGGFDLSAGLVWVALQGTSVRNSQVELTTPLEVGEGELGTDEFNTVIGNGRYSAHYLIGTLSVGARFDEIL